MSDRLSELELELIAVQLDLIELGFRIEALEAWSVTR
jgi:hypothetical protein